MTLATDRAERAFIAFWHAYETAQPYAVEAMSYADGDMRYAYWLHRVNRRCIARVGMTIWDLPDYLWRDAFDDDMSPSEAWSDFLLSIEDEFNLEEMI